MRTGFLITARLKSSRLPKKLLLEVNGESILVWMIRRLKLAKELDEIVICTSTNEQDKPLIEIAKQEGIKWFAGSEEDVIDRLYSASQEFNLDYVINMTADCPLVPYDLIGEVIETFKETNADLIKCHHLPVGLFLSGINPKSLKKIIEMKDSDHTEYWLNYFLKTDLFKVVQLETNPEWHNKNYRAALDYPEDWEVIKTIYEKIGKDTYKISTADLVKWMDNNQEVFELNRDCNAKGSQRTEEDKTSHVTLKKTL